MFGAAEVLVEHRALLCLHCGLLCEFVEGSSMSWDGWLLPAS